MSETRGGIAASRRFWTAVTLEPTAEGFALLLDGRILQVPGEGALLVPEQPLAEAVAAEWRAAGEGRAGGSYRREALELTRLASTRQFRVAPRREAVIDGLLAYFDNDLLCYRATHPAPLVAQQSSQWQPWLDWCSVRIGAPLRVTDGVMPTRQPAGTRAAMHRALSGLDDAALCALGVLAPALGSLLLGLACVQGALPPEDAHRLSMLDDLFQATLWGVDGEAEQRRAALLLDVVGAGRFLDLARQTASERGATHLLVSGRVQGVGYRAWLQNEARQLALRGWVRNLADGRVEALVAGAASDRAALVEAAHRGPRLAAVREVATTFRDHTVIVEEDVAIRPTGGFIEPGDHAGDAIMS